MLRRELLQSIVALPLMRHLTVNDKTIISNVHIPSGHYMVYADVNSIDIERLVNSPLPAPNITMDIVPVRLYGDRTIEDVVKIYKVGE